jgi:hypothetical protein
VPDEDANDSIGRAGALDDISIRITARISKVEVEVEAS